ncbi:conserved protein of unknown function [Pararobbsia alpina]|uniref:hypothetical protein n=1 Tax=Pararobbsia alpina TaxID=621374 RepID=UPI0039A4017E
MSTLLAIDPGTTQSGWVIVEDSRVMQSGVMPNPDMLNFIDDCRFCDDMAIEMIASYGMAVGREVFETCVWIGRFIECFRDPDLVRLVYRKDVKLHLCGTPRAKDANIRQALIDLYPATGGGKTPQIGTKSQPGPLYGVTSHAWPALAVAVTANAQRRAA